MANFYGEVQGERGKGTRLGHRGITTKAASWSGAVVVDVRSDDSFEVRMEQHESKGDFMIIATGQMGDAQSLRTAFRGSFVDMPDADLLRLAGSAGALGWDRDGSAIAFTVSELREFVRMAMAHEELVRATGTGYSAFMKKQAA